MIYKNIVLGLIITALMSSALVGLAMWYDTLKVNAYVDTGELDWEFVNGTIIYNDACGLAPGYGFFAGNDWNASFLPSPGALQLDKDVGCTVVSLIDTDSDGDSDTMNITLVNVYPWYYTHIAFKVHNDGTIPLKIWRVRISNGTHEWSYYELNEQVLQQGVYVDLNSDGKADILIWWGDNFGEQLHPCQSADISLDLTVLQDAPENTTLTLYIFLEAVQWNEYTPGP
ncbi:hypothetical protein J4526_06770 [Desulfurococcaceae archaeon MEX13E-LK6-19]|nr:hypothetical protein J4526_06770 [Desulfurococcaceae archaeon MEX13E-LK6-19]